MSEKFKSIEYDSGKEIKNHKEEARDSEFDPGGDPSGKNEGHAEMPYFRQENDYYCGPAILQMILERFGIKKSQEEIAKVADTNSERGTFHRDLLKMVRENGLYAYAKRHATVKEIEKFVDEGLPIVVNYIEPEGDGHYAIVVGYDTQDLVFNDPWHGKNFRFPKKEFESRWHNMRKTSFGWLMVVSKDKKDIKKMMSEKFPTS